MTTTDPELEAARLKAQAADQEAYDAEQVSRRLRRRADSLRRNYDALVLERNGQERLPFEEKA